MDMNINYELPKQNYTYTLHKKDSTESVFVSNTKGDFFHQGVYGPTTKFHGFTYCNSKTLEMFKVIDNFFINTKHTPESVTTNGCEIVKQYPFETTNSYSYAVEEEDKKYEEFGEQGELFYDNNGNLKEHLNSPHPVKPKEKIYVGPTGGIVYDVENFSGTFTLDLDMRKHDDFNEWGRIYNVYRKDSTLFVHYSKYTNDSQEYELYFAIDLPNDDYNLQEEWVEKHYQYSKMRNSLHIWYVFRPLTLQIQTSQRLYMASGLSEKEVEDQIYLLKHHYEELLHFDIEMKKELLSEPNFSKPLTQDVYVAYELSKSALYTFLSKNMDGLIQQGSFAGYPWFHQIWTRDELVSMRGYLELEDYSFVLSKLFDYIREISPDTGELPRIHKKESLTSEDGVFWLAKRIEDCIFDLEEKGLLRKYLGVESIQYAYRELAKAFSNIIKTNWDNEKELLFAKQGDSWMDTVDGGYTLDIQVQLLGMISTLSVLAGMLNKKEDEEHYADLEHLLKNKIITTYYNNGRLYNDCEHTVFNSNVFLSYYFYPQLFEKNEWESIIDKALQEMKLPWGGISSLSKYHPQFCENYTGEDNVSYHRGDSWYWINNITAIVLNDLNEKKYRATITAIVFASTKDILKMGTFGYGSEISSASQQEARGCLAQLWSSSTYVEMIHHLFNKEHL